MTHTEINSEIVAIRAKYIIHKGADDHHMVDALMDCLVRMAVGAKTSDLKFSGEMAWKAKAGENGFAVVSLEADFIHGTETINQMLESMRKWCVENGDRLFKRIRNAKMPKKGVRK